jgi:transposase-like protein
VLSVICSEVPVFLNSTISALMSISRPTCPNCGSQHTVKNGKIHNQKPKYQCQNCKRQFIENPTNKVISKDTAPIVVLNTLLKMGRFIIKNQKLLLAKILN